MTTEPLLVDCTPFGQRQVDCRSAAHSPDELAQLKNLVATSWDSYWSLLYEVTEEMAEQVLGIYDFDASFESHDFRIHIYRYSLSNGLRGQESPRDGDNVGLEQVMFRIEFLDADSQVMCPVFDTTFEGLEVVHCQPCF